MIALSESLNSLFDSCLLDGAVGHATYASACTCVCKPKTETRGVVAFCLKVEGLCNLMNEIRRVAL